MNSITVPLDNEHDSKRSCENTNDLTFTQPDQKTGDLVTSLPYILKHDDDSCLDLSRLSLSPRPTLDEKLNDIPPLVPAKMVTTTTEYSQHASTQCTDNSMLHNISSPQHLFMTPPTSPPAVNYIHDEEDEYNDDDEDDENMVLSPPPSAKSLTAEFNSFASGTIDGMVNGNQGSTTSKNGAPGACLAEHNNNNNDNKRSQEQKLPAPPHHQQLSSLPKVNSSQHTHTSLSKSLPSLENEPSQHIHAHSMSTTNSPISPSFMNAAPTKDIHPMKKDSGRHELDMGKAQNHRHQQQRPSTGTDNMIVQHTMIPDGAYYPDSSLYAASITKPAPHPLSLAPHHPRFPPATLENLNNFRRKAQASPRDAALQLNFAKFLMEAVEQARIDDVTRAIKAKTAMLSEAQRIVKTLAMHSSSRPVGGGGGDADAQFYLANAYGAGLMLLRVNHEKAFHLYLQGSKQGHPGCTYRAGVCYELGLGTARRDNARAIRFYRKAANLGDPSAMYKLAIILLRGLLGQSKHPKEAIAWLTKAAPLADAYHPEILHELGLAYEHEGVVPSVIADQDYTCELLTKAARFGYAPSQFKLGMVYENGLWGCPMDARRSIAWYAKAAEQGHLESALALSGWYLTGAKTMDGIDILPQNDLEAYLWAKKVAEAGYAKGQYACGYYSETGIGVDPNVAQAMHWYELAAQQQYAKAITRLDELKQNSKTTTTANRQRVNQRMRLSLQTSQSYLAKTDTNVEQRNYSTSRSSHSSATTSQPRHSLQQSVETTTQRSSMEKSSGCLIM
ncbi:hypothetical protein BCR42DRAFT_414219 [Absidia repens]|uniref:HCP-like protein n=1 Tax=Absidia repens TaxID=90262 RepID=A0A1X2IIQ2_9FUNG|nr:hypothetical protein BCR42DRAFT_414219 [Absidia repens]